MRILSGTTGHLVVAGASSGGRYLHEQRAAGELWTKSYQSSRCCPRATSTGGTSEPRTIELVGIRGIYRTNGDSEKAHILVLYLRKNFSTKYRQSIFLLVYEDRGRVL